VGKAHGIDWRLLAAVAYAESRFDPKAESRFGAKGLMQLLPSTAKRVGVTDLLDPRKNVLAGARYLERLMKIFADDGVDPRQQIRFALAAYNCGLGHVMDARDIARKIGKDPDRWFNEVEDAMRLKQNPKWHRRTRYGYARARETIAYVSRIQSQYDVFARHVPLEPPSRANQDGSEAKN
jgi:membrane-bound lytic murein transglycosylase F